MREILFRGKRIDNGAWVEGCLDFNDATTLVFIRTPRHIHTDVNMVHPDTVGQYTGLKDKNGQRIFENDIVKIGEHDTMVNGLYRVIFDTANHCWALERAPEHNYSYFSFSDLNGFADSSEVIGNIHDNGELIHEK